MVFAPKLGEGVAFNQPVSQPNAMGAIADLFNFGVSTLKDKGNAPKLTEDEKFAIAVREFEGEKGAAFQWDRKGMREFIFKHPQFTSQAKGFGENLGIMTTTPLEASRDAVLEWAKTPEGVMASAVASGMEEEEANAYISEQFTKQKQQEAEIAKINRNAEQLTAEGTLQGKQWDAIKPAQKDMVDATVQSIIGPIVTDVMNGNTVEVPQEIQAILGVRYDRVDMANLPALLADAKTALGNNARSTFLNNFGADTLPSEQWNKEVFSSLDALIEVGKAIDTPQERAAAMEALIQTETYKRLDAAGVAVTIEILKTLPPDTAARVLGEISLDGPMSKVLAPTEGGRLFGTAEITKAVGSLSTEDADKLAADTIKIIEKGITPEFFTAFKEATNRTGYKVVDGASYKAIVGENLTEIKRLTSENPEFRGEFGQWLASDIQQTITAIENNLPSNVSLVMGSNGRFVAVYVDDGNPNKSRAEAAMGAGFGKQQVDNALASLPDGMNLNTLNEKLSSLGLMGEFGKEVQGAIGILNTEPASKGKSSAARPPKGRGRGRARNVGAELGIDFEGYEVEAGLPTGFLNTMALIESGGNPSAQNSESSAGGLFQQIDSNAAQYGVADRFDPVQSTEGAVAFAQDNTVYLAGKLGREPTGGELYLAHQQGPAGAARLLANPDSLAVDIVGEKAVKLNGGSTDMTAQEFANIWINKYNKIATGGIGPAGAPVSVTEPKTPTLPLDSASPDASVMQTGTASNTPVESLGGTVEALNSPEVQQIVEKAQTAPEEALTMAKEVLTRPIDPMVKALIEALVMIGEKKT